MATQPVTRLLLEWSAGNEFALEKLTPLVYHQLRHLAARYLGRERHGHTLQPTELVHEAYLQLVEQNHQTWASRSHFFGIAAHSMRLILVDRARKARAGKRGDGFRAVPLEEAPDVPSSQRPDEFIALHDALAGLEGVDPGKAKIIELRYFGGLAGEEIARCLSISTATVEREMRFAQLWLSREMKGHAMK